jgi:hypothetical protein
MRTRIQVSSSLIAWPQKEASLLGCAHVRGIISRWQANNAWQMPSMYKDQVSGVPPEADQVSEKGKIESKTSDLNTET